MAKKKSPSQKSSRTRSASRSGGRSGAGSGGGKSRGRSGGGSGGRSGGRGPQLSVDPTGKHLDIVESPTKAKTINRYLGPDYAVIASVGHVRDLPKSAPSGAKRADHPVPGVDLDNDFEPTYEVLPDKKKTVSEIKKAAAKAADVYFATDLDREGEAIAWHLTQALGVDPASAKRVVFNAITKSDIQAAFEHPRPIEQARVDAQQARRILDRIVGYQVSPLLWKKVAGGLSAGRVQSVATRLVVEREREIEAFVPDEYWRITGLFATPGSITPQAQAASAAVSDLAADFRDWLDTDRTDQHGKPWPRSVKETNAWLSDHACLRSDLIETTDADGNTTDFKPDNREHALAVAQALGFELEDRIETQDPKAKGPAKNLCVFKGTVDLDTGPRFTIQSITTKRTSSRPPGPFITSTLQQTASNRLGFALQRTMRIAQQLYEGIDLKGSRGQTGLITYMRTDSTHLSGHALEMARGYIGKQLGDKYLPEKPNFFSSSNKSAQEAHEAIRPTDVALTPDSIKQHLSEEQYRLYRLIWQRFVACQMTPAQWDSTTILINAQSTQAPHDPAAQADSPGGQAGSAGGQAGSPAVASATFKATGRTLVFDGFMKVSGIPQGDDVILPPELAQGQPVHPLDINPTQHFTSPPPRYTEASIQKKLEEEGIGRPSTYASIISVIQDRKYVEPLTPRDRRLMATDLGKVVTDLLVKAFPEIMNVPFTREMEADLDKIESEHADWRQQLHHFYDPFIDQLATAHDELDHAKAVTEPAPHTCPRCGAPTEYRFGRNGRFLSCTAFNVPPQKVRVDGHPGEWWLHKAKGKARPKILSADGNDKVLWTKLTKDDKQRFQELSDQMPEPCTYAAPIDREGNPMGPEQTDVVCPADGQPMIRRTGRFGPFLAAASYPDTQYIVKLDPKTGGVVLPKVAPYRTDIPCPKCNEDAHEHWLASTQAASEEPTSGGDEGGGLGASGDDDLQDGRYLQLRDGKNGLWLGCEGFPKCRGRMGFTKLPDDKQAQLQAAWQKHVEDNPVDILHKTDGTVVPEGYIPQVAQAAADDNDEAGDAAMEEAA